MKKVLLALISLALAASTVNAKEISKTGFLTTEYCYEMDYFSDCSLSEYNLNISIENVMHKDSRKTQLVIYVHNDLTYYKVDASHLPLHELDEGFARNNVTIIGHYDKKTNTIKATEYKGPPPPAKSFFKGCL